MWQFEVTFKILWFSLVALDELGQTFVVLLVMRL